MSLLQRHVDRCVATIEAICRSSDVDYYLVGYTSNSRQRAQSYREWEAKHFILLAEHMECSEASAFEVSVQKEIGRRRKSVAYRKYHPEKKEKGVIYASTGGRSPKGRICSVYMTWWSR